MRQNYGKKYRDISPLSMRMVWNIAMCKDSVVYYLCPWLDRWDFLLASSGSSIIREHAIC